MTRLIDADALLVTKKIMRVISLMTTQLDVSRTPELHNNIYNIILSSLSSAPQFSVKDG